ncbi:uncharacterized protein LOC132717351 [Ruditapes philippinarum]|uniref:uncharacterized protein LOC132717351 n=1 Tax=Ruditapes philippinarum TaxID=129788 RepID=UPI00295ACD00|nr:uncharacterized protein LOC132717351 [Ruditapes philippinarum]
MRNYNLTKDNSGMENLSTNKRRFLENWRQNVSVFMENGNICRVTVGEVTPEPYGDTTKWQNAENMKALTGEMSPRGEMASPTLPSVKFSYSHGQEELAKQNNRIRSDRSRDSLSQARTTLPPSPNGVVVQNGMDLHTAYKRRTSSMKANNKIAVNKELPEVTDNKDTTRKSTRLAREIYEKYNMKSKTHNALPGKHTYNGFEQYSMPWRNKTFLSLPLRFNGSTNMGARREKTYISEMKYDADDFDEEINFTSDWKDHAHW